MMTWFRKLRWLTQRRRREAELSEELEFHLSEEAKLREEDGEAQDAAQFAARRELGNLALVQEDTRATWGWTVEAGSIRPMSRPARPATVRAMSA